MYKLDYTDEAKRDMQRLKREEPKAFLKLGKLLEELMEHPKVGTGKPEPLSGDRAGQWSRRITKKHRLVYAINDTEVVVLVLTTYGHYGDK
ncbi:MAG: Txe/YoeB family addiction module toxin [Bacteroidaceae bacterium]|nr:Txe/YoeB family addiction module toxin [Bacteroidaceae bacterium]